MVQDPRRELFDLVGLLDLGPLHRQRLRNHPARQAGHHLRRRTRGPRLDDVQPVRRDGRHVVEVQRPGEFGIAGLRRRSRRLRHRRRRRRARPGGTGARQGTRRQDLRRDHRLRRHFGRLRHGGAIRRRGGALHAAGAGRRPRTGRLHQHPRNLDAGRRLQGDRGDPRRVRQRHTLTSHRPSR